MRDLIAREVYGLLIEDSASDALFLEAALQEAPNSPLHGFVRCETLASGIAAAKTTPFDLILLDLNLPDSSGIETFRRLRLTLPETLVIVLTATMGEELAAQAMDEGAQDVIFKDRLDPYWIAHTIRRAQSRHQLLKRTLEAEERELASAKRAARIKSEFLAAVSHEIRTPLSAMAMATDLLLMEDELSAEHAETVMLIKRNSDHLMRVLNDVLDLSRLEAGRLHVDLAAMAVMPVVIEVCATFGAAARAKSLGLRVLDDGTAPSAIRTDPTRFRQILSNLVGNAVKFTTEGEILVTCGLRDGAGSCKELYVVVSDTGIGLSKVQALRLFEPFSQADDKIQGRYGGSGLGLSLARGMAEALGGAVTLEESAPGKGSTFAFTLRLADGDELGPLQPLIPLVSKHGHETEAREGRQS